MRASDGPISQASAHVYIVWTYVYVLTRLKDISLATLELGPHLLIGFYGKHFLMVTVQFDLNRKEQAVARPKVLSITLGSACPI